MAISTEANGSSTNGAGQMPRHSPASLAHVVLRTTTDTYKGMIEFYVNVLNGYIVHTTPVLTFIRYDYEHHRIAIIQTPETTPKPKDAGHAGLDHVALTYPTLTSLAQQYTYLKSMPKPLRPLWTVNHGPTTSLYYRDADGNKIELQVDNFDDLQDADDFMKGPLYGANPIGTDFDADKWAEDILSKATVTGDEGLSQEEIKSQKTRIEIGDRHTLPEGF